MDNFSANQEKTQKDMRCLVCSNVTHHELRFSHVAYVPDDEEYDPVISDEGPDAWEKREYRVWICLGCDNARFEIAHILHGYGPDDEEYSTFFPKKQSSGREKKDFFEISNDLKSIYSEVIESYNSNLTISCAVGIRALLEGICADKGITDDDAWELEKKLRLLCEQQQAPSGVIDALFGLKLMGDVAAHRLSRARTVELMAAIELAETLLEFMYEIKPLVQQRADLVAHLTKKRILTHEEEKRAKKERKARAKQSPQSAG